jgi:hypothetical protein
VIRGSLDSATSLARFSISFVGKRYFDGVGLLDTAFPLDNFWKFVTAAVVGEEELWTTT